MSGYVVRKELYSADDLLAGFDAETPESFTSTYDFLTFRQFVRDGGPAPVSVEARLEQVRHDAYIAAALAAHLSSKPRLVGFMGGHSVARDEESYRHVALLSRQLSRTGFLVASGGGPGAMEAAHVGAACAPFADEVLEEVLGQLATEAALPPLAGVVLPDGSIDSSRLDDVRAAHRWLLAAVRARNTIASGIGPSLAIPTWLYGQEPTMPFATAYAKYFQNSIREEALVTEARAGIVYARGGGGTIREIFQDVEQNYYVSKAADFTPMVFFDPDHYWERDAEIDVPGRVVLRPGLKIDETITKVFTLARAKLGDIEECMSKVRFTVDFDEITSVLQAHAPGAEQNLARVLAGRSIEILGARWNR